MKNFDAIRSILFSSNVAYWDAILADDETRAEQAHELWAAARKLF